MKPCSGLIVTSFSKSELKKNLEDVLPVFGAYNRYKKITSNPLGYPGKLFVSIISIQNCLNFLDYEWENRLRYVRIYFDTPTFDRITKDRAAKFVDMLSAIGGTMGLLTGFSIISGVEILYFVCKSIFANFRKKKN